MVVHDRANYPQGVPAIGVEPALASGMLPRLPNDFLREVMQEMPVARLASISGYKGWKVRYEERFHNGKVGPGRSTFLVVTGDGVEIHSDTLVHRNPQVVEALLAHQVLRRLAEAGHGTPVNGSLFARGTQAHRLVEVCKTLHFQKPRLELVSGNPDRLRQFIAQCYVPFGDSYLQSSGIGSSINEACQSASQKILSNQEFRSRFSLRPVSDPSTVLVGAVLRAGFQKPEFLIHHTLEPIGVACVIEVPGRGPLRFLGHADSLNNAREVGASRAYEWIIRRLPELRRASAGRETGGTEH